MRGKWAVVGSTNKNGPAIRRAVLIVGVDPLLNGDLDNRTTVQRLANAITCGFGKICFAFCRFGDERSIHTA